MGLPQIIIDFKTKAETAIKRSENGIVAVILADTTYAAGEGSTSYVYNYETDIDADHWSESSLDYLNMVFMGAPKRVLVERVGDTGTLSETLTRLKNKVWNYLTVPDIENIAEENPEKTISDWIIAQRAIKKPFKAVLPNSSSSNNEGIISFETDNIQVGEKTYSTAEYCARIAGLLAGLSMTESATYQVLPEVDNIDEITNPDEVINSGGLILINDGEKIKIARGVNSLSILSDDKTEDMKKIKIIDAMDLMREDIRKTFEDNYVGINNTYDNKVMFVSAVNQYFDTLVRLGVLYDKGENRAEIDVDGQRLWLADRYDITDWTEDQIKQAKTGSYVFVKARVSFADSMEDLIFNIYME